jgi:hypothetical protein
MKIRLKAVFIVIVFSLLIVNIKSANAQCAQCAATVASNKSGGGTTANGLNHGILYLLAAPYLAAAAIGFLWYKKYRRKNVNIAIRDEKLHLN